MNAVVSFTDSSKESIPMNWMEQLGGILQQYTSANTDALPQVTQDFEQVAQAAPPSTLADGLAAAFRSDRTPAFGDMVANLFSNSGGEQQAGLLNTLIAAAGPTLVSQILSRRGGDGIDLSRLLNSGQTEVAPEQAQQIPTDAVREIATQAEKQDPSIIDQISSFYSEHPTLVKTLGSAALSIALAKLAQRHSGH
jgi:hypothetical protein